MTYDHVINNFNKAILWRIQDDIMTFKRWFESL